MPLEFEYIEKINKRQNRVYISHKLYYKKVFLSIRILMK